MVIHNVEQGSFEWHQLRIGKVTGSTLKRVITSKWVEYSDEIAAERITGDRDVEQFETFEMQLGKEREPIARDLVIRKTGIGFQQFGFIENKSVKGFGLSPDGITKSGNFGLEIKCPSPKAHIRYIRQDKIPTEYYYQVLSYFLVSDKMNVVYFVSYCPEIDEKLFIKTIYRDQVEAKIESIKSDLVRFENRVQATIELIQST